MRQCMTKLSTDEDAYDARDNVEKKPITHTFSCNHLIDILRARLKNIFGEAKETHPGSSKLVEKYHARGRV